MRISLQFERCSAADRVRTSQQRLKRYHDMLPPEALMSGIVRQLRGRAAIYAAHHLDRASHGQRIYFAGFWNSRAFKPSSVDDQPLGKGSLQPV